MAHMYGQITYATDAHLALMNYFAALHNESDGECAPVHCWKLISIDASPTMLMHTIACPRSLVELLKVHNNCMHVS